MLRSMLKSKIHRATVTDKSLDYDGSITIDPVLMADANIVRHEQVQVLNLNNGNRFETYVISGKRDKGQIELNGPAARLGEVGDKVVIVAYAMVPEEDISRHKPKIVFVDAKNRPVRK